MHGPRVGNFRADAVRTSADSTGIMAGMISLVSLGGQRGADQVECRAAEACAILTLGWMPKGFLAENGAGT
jgi:hypothetical protein